MRSGPLRIRSVFSLEFFLVQEHLRTRVHCAGLCCAFVAHSAPGLSSGLSRRVPIGRTSHTGPPLSASASIALARADCTRGQALPARVTPITQCPCPMVQDPLVVGLLVRLGLPRSWGGRLDPCPPSSGMGDTRCTSAAGCSQVVSCVVSLIVIAAVTPAQSVCRMLTSGEGASVHHRRVSYSVTCSV